MGKQRENENGTFSFEEQGMQEITAQVMGVYNDGAIDSVYLKEKEGLHE